LNAVEVSGYRIYFKAQVSRRLDTARLKKEQPELVESYSREIVTRPLRVFAV